MVNFFLAESPFMILLLASIILSSITTTKQYLFYMDILILLSADFIFLLINIHFIDAWLLLFITLFIFIHKNKESLTRIFSSGNKIKLEGIEQYIYDRDFKFLFTEEEFKMLLDISQLRKTKDKLNLATEGEKIDKLIYLATVPKYKSLILKTKDTIISYLKEGAWLGKYQKNKFYPV